ncbi:MAG TPA: LysR substrate-binding domain-containing protein [Acidimicrobiales bacterium]
MTPAIRSDAGHDRCAWVGHRGPARATANTQLVPTALGRFRERHPSVATTVAEALTTELLADLRSGALDVAVVSDHPTGVLPAHGVALVHPCDDPLLVALRRDHPVAGADAIDLRDVAGECWIEAGLHGDDTVLAAACARAGFGAARARRPNATTRVSWWPPPT